MSTTTPDVFDEQVLDQLSRQAVDFYNANLKSVLEPKHDGETLALHLDSGDYALARSSSAASRTLRARKPEGLIVTLLIGPEQMDQQARRMLGGRLPANPNK